MDEQHLHNDFLNGETPPVPVPPVSQAWNGMRERLDAHLPVLNPFQRFVTRWWRFAVGGAGASVIVAGIVWYVLQPSIGNKNVVNNTVETLNGKGFEGDSLKERGLLSGNDSLYNEGISSNDSLRFDGNNVLDHEKKSGGSGDKSAANNINTNATTNNIESKNAAANPGITAVKNNPGYDPKNAVSKGRNGDAVLTEAEKKNGNVVNKSENEALGKVGKSNKEVADYGAKNTTNAASGIASKKALVRNVTSAGSLSSKENIRAGRNKSLSNTTVDLTVNKKPKPGDNAVATGEMKKASSAKSNIVHDRNVSNVGNNPKASNSIGASTSGNNHKALDASETVGSKKNSRASNGAEMSSGKKNSQASNVVEMSCGKKNSHASNVVEMSSGKKNSHASNVAEMSSSKKNSHASNVVEMTSSKKNSHASNPEIIDNRKKSQNSNLPETAGSNKDSQTSNSSGNSYSKVNGSTDSNLVASSSQSRYTGSGVSKGNGSEKTAMPFGELNALPVANAFSDLLIKRTRISTNNALLKGISVPETNRANAGLWGNWSFWLQWGVALPLQGTGYYFSGPTGSAQPYRNLLPGLRIEKGFGSNASVSLNVVPFTSRTINPLVFNSTTTRSSPDSTSISDSVLTTSKALVKQFGSAAALQFNYQLAKHWWVSAGVDGTLWGNSLWRTRYDHVKVGKVIDTLSRDTSGVSKPFVKLRLSAVAEVYYQVGNWQLGLRAGLPLTKLGSDSTKSYRNPVEATLMVRWRIPSLKKK